ncbi:hypothetical protein [Taklimakanibacter deserti]|uniref:hypothetical protein n=1 Tax=Taklimakanibacter deserti TaxID=2267839 RepID=UPI000E65097C
MSLIRNCLNKLVRSGQITRNAANSAVALYEGMQGRMVTTMPPASADAAAALEAAKVMAEAAKRKKLTVAKNAIAFADVEAYVLNHPHSRIAGVMGVLTRDIRDAGRLNVESHRVAVEDWLLAKANTLIENYRSKLGGLRHDFVGPRNVIKELRGVDTGDQAAKEAAAAWRGTVEAGVKRAEQAGIFFRSIAEKDQWLNPQFWESARVRSFGLQEFEKDIFEAWRSGGLEIVNKETGELATDLEVPEIVRMAHQHIVVNDNTAAHGSAFNSVMRTFRFKNADTWLKLMDKYGVGEGGIYGMLISHVRGMANEISLAEVLGPSYQTNFKRLLDLARYDDKGGGRPDGRFSPSKYNPVRLVESVAAAERTFKWLTGEINSVQGETMAGVFGAVRNIATAANLGSAVITAVPGDSVTAVLASGHSGISAVGVMQRAIEGIAGEGPEMRALAARLNVTAHAVIDGMHSSRRFGDQLEVGERFGQIASFVIRAQGLNFWTTNLKRAFSMEFMAHLAENSGKGFDDLEPAFRGFLERYAFTADEWDLVRATPALEVEGARFFDAEGMADPALRNRLMSAIIDERQFAVLESGARVRQLTTGGLHRGTFMGEMARSAGMYKSFAISILLTHVMRHMTAPGSFLKRGTNLSFKFLLPMTIAGGVSLQAKQILSGKDPRDMSDPGFWLDAFVTGGAAGIYGDLLKTAIGGGPQEQLSTLLAGPPGQIVGATGDLTFDQARKFLTGEGTDFGKTMARHMRRWLPGSNLWYARLALDRFVFDEIQEWIDPNYKASFRRQEERLRRNTGQKFWWRPGHKAPSRAPDLL